MNWTVVIPPAAQLRRNSWIARFAEANSIRLQDYDYIATYRPEGIWSVCADAHSLAATVPASQVVLPALIPLGCGAEHLADYRSWLNCATVAIDWAYGPTLRIHQSRTDRWRQGRSRFGEIDCSRPQSAVGICRPKGRVECASRADCGIRRYRFGYHRTVLDPLPGRCRRDTRKYARRAAVHPKRQVRPSRMDKWVKDGMRFTYRTSQAANGLPRKYLNVHSRQSIQLIAAQEFSRIRVSAPRSLQTPSRDPGTRWPDGPVDFDG